MDFQQQRALRVLEAVEQDQRITQRGLAAKLGVALGLTNLYLKRLVRKGYIKCVNVKSNRIRYLITPQGISEKARLTLEFMDYSLALYREVRQHLRSVLDLSARDGHDRIAICGTGEVAELTYLTLKELGLEPSAIFDLRDGGAFLGMPVRNVREHCEVEYDLMIVAALDNREKIVAALVGHGVPEEALVTVGKLK